MGLIAGSLFWRACGASKDYVHSIAIGGKQVKQRMGVKGRGGGVAGIEHVRFRPAQWGRGHFVGHPDGQQYHQPPGGDRRRGVAFHLLGARAVSVKRKQAHLIIEKRPAGPVGLALGSGHRRAAVDHFVVQQGQIGQGRGDLFDRAVWRVHRFAHIVFCC